MITYSEIKNSHPTIMYTEVNEDMLKWETPQISLKSIVTKKNQKKT